jgi:hypothetical protein
LAGLIGFARCEAAAARGLRAFLQLFAEALAPRSDTGAGAGE